MHPVRERFNTSRCGKLARQDGVSSCPELGISTIKASKQRLTAFWTWTHRKIVYGTEPEQGQNADSQTDNGARPPLPKWSNGCTGGDAGAEGAS